MVCIIATTPDRTHAPTHTHVYANATSSSSFCSLYSLVPFSGKRREVSEALRDPPPPSPADTQPPFLMNNEEEVKAPSYLRHEAVIACIAREEEKGAGLLRNGEDDVNRGRLITEIPPLPHFGKGNHIGGKCSFSLLPFLPYHSRLCASFLLLLRWRRRPRRCWRWHWRPIPSSGRARRRTRRSCPGEVGLVRERVSSEGL